MKTYEQVLKAKIEALRASMISITEKTSLSSSMVVQISSHLDQLLNEYDRFMKETQ